jgi:hypothetical protein
MYTGWRGKRDWTDEFITKVHGETGRQVHGPEWDPTSVPLDGEVIMRIGQEKKHGHYYIGNNILDSASTPTL